ncbi:GIY-YIG nuclease family protein [Echinicola shivajiensis]|uniref:GIY-YIG nuclease family protein n=1 Tax=Echinicola shivajiensis TaxID=1035916 RepID=UPI001BFC6E7A|nr:GIY-YIG nuclease family protein [Echinicola shivajiensis]
MIYKLNNTKEMPSVACVYRITNTINNKFYIGSTNNLQHRMKQHSSYFNINNKLNGEYKKYGLENFNVEIVFQTPFYKTLELTEILQNRDTPLLYNEKISSSTYINKEHSKHPVKVYQFTLEGEYVNEYDSIKEASIKNNMHYQSILYCIQGKYKKAGDYQWTNYKVDKVKPYCKKHKLSA